MTERKERVVERWEGCGVEEEGSDREVGRV